jgi:hypothetical protein
MIGQNLAPANDFVPDHRVQQAGEKAAKYAAASRSKATLRGINVTGRTSRPVRPRTIDNPRRNDRRTYSLRYSGRVQRTLTSERRGRL